MLLQISGKAFIDDTREEIGNEKAVQYRIRYSLLIFIKRYQ